MLCSGLLGDFWRNERYIATLISGKRSKFENEMKNTKIYTGEKAVH